MATREGTTLKQEFAELKKDVEPEPIDTKLEAASVPKPYTAVGKLRGKKA